MEETQCHELPVRPCGVIYRILDDHTAMLSYKGCLLRVTGESGTARQVLVALKSMDTILFGNEQLVKIYRMFRALGASEVHANTESKPSLVLIFGSSYSTDGVSPSRILEGLGFQIDAELEYEQISEQSAVDFPSALLIAIACTEWELYKINRSMLAQGRRWLFTSFDGNRFTVSPILQNQKTPCFACLRLRRLGSLHSVEPNALFEAHHQTGEPTFYIPHKPPSWAIQMITGAVARAISETNDFFILDCRTAASSTQEIMKLQNCIECGE